MQKFVIISFLATFFVSAAYAQDKISCAPGAYLDVQGIAIRAQCGYDVKANPFVVINVENASIVVDSRDAANASDKVERAQKFDKWLSSNIDDQRIVKEVLNPAWAGRRTQAQGALLKIIMN